MMNRAWVAVRWISALVALSAVAAILASAGSATPPPPPPISAGNHPWIVTLCKFTDLSTEPTTYTPSYFDQMFGGTGSSSLDFVDWWSEISYGNISVTGTKVTTAWYSLGMTRYQWAALNRFDKVKTCASSAATDPNIGNDFSKFYGTVAIFNDDSAPRTAATTLPATLNSSDTTFNVASSAGFPPPPFGVTINDGSPNNLEELLVTGVSGSTWTVTRAYENFNPATSHAAGTAINLIDGGDLGAADTGTHGITLNKKNYTLGLVVLPPETNMGAAQHETGHGFGYSHSRALSTSTTDYNDCYDIMSFDSCNYNFTGDFGAAGVLNDPLPAAVGPGLDAILLDVQGWMPTGRTVNFSNSSCTQTTRSLAALNHPEVSGDMELRVPAVLTIPIPGGGTTTSDYYTIELRDKTLWDRGIPQNSVLLHLHGLDGFSYWVDKISGSPVGHGGAFYLADEYVDTANNVVITVNGMNASGHTATVAIAAGGSGGGCKLNANIAYSGDTSGDFNDPVHLAADITVAGSSVPIPFAAVTLSLGSQSCPATTDATGHASCQITPNQVPGPYTATASFAGDAAYNATSGTAAFTLNKEESQIAYTGALASHYHDTVTASAKLTDPDGGAAVMGKTVTFTLGVGDTCSAVTDLAGTVSCLITPTQTGTQNMVASFAGDAYYLSSSDSKPFSITPEETTMKYTGPTVILAGSSGATLTAKLVEDGASDSDGDGGSPGPVPAELVTLSLGSQSCTGTTDSVGNVSCTISSVTVPLGPETVGAAFAGDAYYQPSSDNTTATVFAFPSRGVFALGDRTVATAGTAPVTWWGAQWWNENAISRGASPAAFKGFTDQIKLPTSSPPVGCGSAWTTTGGNSPPPVSGVPSYMGVVVTSSVTKAGSTISGNVVQIVVVKVDPGYAPNPGNAGTGTIVATFC